MKRKESEIKRNLTKLEEEIERKKILPQEEKQKIIKKWTINGIILLSIVIYLILLQVGEANIQTDIYVTILKTIDMILIIGTIILIEIAYKTNKNEMILHSLEALVISFYTLFLIPAYSLYYGNFYKVIICGGTVSIIYYLLKCILITINFKKKYYESLNDIKTIVAK